MECVDCSQRRTVVIDSFVEYTCKGCGKEKIYYNSAVPQFCSECAKEKHICRCCGKEIGENK